MNSYEEKLSILAEMIAFARTDHAIKDAEYDFLLGVAGHLGVDVTTRWITDEELADNPGLVRTMSVKPPSGSGRVRLVSIGQGDAVDLQPCGGTHVRSTGEIGGIAVSKIEKKGRQNRRIRIRFTETE